LGCSVFHSVRETNAINSRAVARKDYLFPQIHPALFTIHFRLTLDWKARFEEFFIAIYFYSSGLDGGFFNV